MIILNIFIKGKFIKESKSLRKFNLNKGIWENDKDWSLEIGKYIPKSNL